MIFIVVILTVPRLIGLGIAVLIYKFGAIAAYQAKMRILSSQGLAYLCWAVWVFSLTTSWLNLFPTFYKGKIMKISSGNIRANMYIYHVNHPDASVKSPCVVLEEEGGIGQYNR